MLELRGVSRRAVVLSVLALVGATQPAFAQGIASVRVEADNDYFSFWLPERQRTDDNYTHGLRVTLEIGGAPWWGRRFARELAPCAQVRSSESPCLSTGFALGQEIYTPRHDSPLPIPGERPYAGWLYAAVTTRVVGAAGSRALTVQLGVTGPPSLAAVVQTSFHRLNPSLSPPLGWRHQVAFEPGVLVAYDRSHLLFERRLLGIRVLDVTPEWGMVVGNIRTGGHVGIGARLGYNLPRPVGAAGRRAGPPVQLYALGAVRQRWVARDLFLDGNTFRASARVEKHPLVRETELGGGLRFRGLTVEYRAVFSSRQYRTEPEPHKYGSIVATIHRLY